MTEVQNDSLPEESVSDTAPEPEETETIATPESTDDRETFPREVVTDLRKENARYRQRAQQADTLAQRLHTELVRATGKLADPTDLAFDETHLDDGDALAAAIDELLADKPHLATRRPAGDIGQGQRGPATSSFSLLDMLKERT